MADVIVELYVHSIVAGQYGAWFQLTTASGGNGEPLRLEQGDGEIEFDIDELALLPGVCQLSARIAHQGQPSNKAIDWLHNCLTLRVDPGKSVRGTFYTPQPLAELVVRRALAPLVADACADDILTVRVIDPAMGSGAFLVAACRYLSHAYERALVNEGRCAETDLDPDMRANIRRTVAARCLGEMVVESGGAGLRTSWRWPRSG